MTVPLPSAEDAKGTDQEIVTVPLPSGDESIKLNLQAILGEGWETIVRPELIKAFVVGSGFAQEKISILINPLIKAEKDALVFFSSARFKDENINGSEFHWDILNKKFDKREVKFEITKIRNGNPVLPRKGTHTAEIEQKCGFNPKVKIFIDDDINNCQYAKWTGCKVLVANSPDGDISHLFRLANLIKYLNALPSPEKAITFFKAEIENPSADLQLIFIQATTAENSFEKAVKLQAYAEMLNWRGFFLQQHGEVEIAVKYFAKAIKIIENLFAKWQPRRADRELAADLNLLKSCLVTNLQKAQEYLKAKLVTTGSQEGKAKGGESKDTQEPTFPEATIEFLAKHGIGEQNFFAWYIHDYFNNFDDRGSLAANPSDANRVLQNHIAMLDWWSALLQKQGRPELARKFEERALETQEFLLAQLKKLPSVLNYGLTRISYGDLIKRIENELIPARKKKLAADPTAVSAESKIQGSEATSADKLPASKTVSASSTDGPQPKASAPADRGSQERLLYFGDGGFEMLLTDRRNVPAMGAGLGALSSAIHRFVSSASLRTPASGAATGKTEAKSTAAGSSAAPTAPASASPASAPLPAPAPSVPAKGSEPLPTVDALAQMDLSALFEQLATGKIPRSELQILKLMLETSPDASSEAVQNKLAIVSNYLQQPGIQYGYF